MKRLLVLLFVIPAFLQSSAAAQPMSVGLYGDFAGTTCNITDDQPGLLVVYVLMTAPGGATAVQFAAPKPSCMVGATWLSDGCPYCMIGNSQVGIPLGFGTCMTGFFEVLSINYFVAGTSEPCCLYPVIPDPHVASGKIEATDCDYQLVYPWGEMSTVNGDSSCPCGYPVAVEETTWGKVKSMYVE